MPDKPSEPDTQDAPKQGRPLGRFIWRGFWIILAICLCFFLGNISVSLGLLDLGHQLGITSSLTRSGDTDDSQVSTRQLSARLDEVSRYLDNSSLYRYTQKDLDQATAQAINGLLATSNDPYAQYFTPEQYADYQRNSEGAYEGIGVVLTLIDDKITVLQVYQDTPAGDAGVLTGDVLVAIDGDRHDWGLQEAIQAIQRPAGTSLTLTWQRDGKDRDTTLTVADISVPAIITHLIEEQGHKVGYIYLRRFNLQSGTEVANALQQLDAQGADSFVLDLRGNPGGYITQAIQITSLFVPQGVVVWIEDSQGKTSREVTGHPLTDKPLSVIINGDSASASELVSAALQDHGRATIVGQQSYGKGSVQDFEELSWGGAIKYTIAHYLSPNGHTINGVGVTPDVKVAPASDTSANSNTSDSSGDSTNSSDSSGSSDSTNSGDNSGASDSTNSNNSQNLTLEDIISSSAYQYSRGVDPQLDAALDALSTKDTKATQS